MTVRDWTSWLPRAACLLEVGENIAALPALAGLGGAIDAGVKAGELLVGAEARGDVGPDARPRRLGAREQEPP